MKRWLSACVVVCVSIFSATGAERRNNSLPENPDTLRILAVGNSFSDDGMMFLPDLIGKAEVGPVVLGRLFVAGCSLERHCRFCRDGISPYVYFKSSGHGWDASAEKVSLLQALADERWDIVVLQQASVQSGLAESYVPWLDELIAAVLKHTDNPRLCIAWQMTWAFASDCTRSGYENYDCDPQRMYEAIVDAARRMVAGKGIDVMIPTGTAIQNLRLHDTPSAREFTRDGFHLDLGIGRYAAACTWFEALIAPVYGISVAGNPFRVPEPPKSGRPVSDAEAADCQRAAGLAVRRPFQTTLFP